MLGGGRRRNCQARVRPGVWCNAFKRVIQQQLQNELARELLAGEFPEGSHVRVDFVQDGFVFSKVG